MTEGIRQAMLKLDLSPDKEAPYYKQFDDCKSRIPKSKYCWNMDQLMDVINP